jgi:diguanylate cyclase (GGDEF)-like protein
MILRSKINTSRNLNELELLQKDLEIQRLQIDQQHRSRILWIISSTALILFIVLISVFYIRSSQQSHRFQELSRKDFLTGLNNRRAFVEQAVSVLEQLGLGPEETYSIILCDVDHFKRFNDNFGHECGDMALIWVAGLLESGIRQHDILARWGGEEFIVLLPNTNLNTATEIAQRLRRVLADKSFYYAHRSMDLTMTFGVSQREEGESLDMVIAHADMGLLKGKGLGRNQVNSWRA